jgi:indolepyruvate ferredoxin oxidoreductase beta subunit
MVDTEAICQRIGSGKVANVALLGAAAASGVLGVSLQEVERTIEARLSSKFVDINKKALHAGAGAGEDEG